MTDKEFLSVRREIIENQFGNLNDMQKKAVFSTEGPLLVLAGAGSGKTTVLVNRIANMISFGSGYNSDYVPADITPYDEAMLFSAKMSGEVPDDIKNLLSVHPIKPWNILAITFTNKAAAELKSRIEAKIGPSAEDVWASTFHSACCRMLRMHGDRLGYSNKFTIYDTDDSKRVIRDCIKEVGKETGIDEKIISPKSVVSAISNAKNSVISPDEYIEQNSNDFVRKSIGMVYKEYQRRLREADAMDFDDLILNVVDLLENFPDVLEYYQNKFRYILVDEYQDTNTMQFRLVSLLADKFRNICVVGDDGQSIYKFRGATIENILNFNQVYPDAKIIKLEQNYRSTQTILDAANAVISNNTHQIDKKLWTSNGKGDSIIYFKAPSDRDEGAFVANEISSLMSKGEKASDFAVLYRMNSQSNLIEQALIRNGISYKIFGGHKFYDRKEIKDCIAYLCVVSNESDYVRLARIINEPKRGIGDASFNNVQLIADNLGLSMIEVMENAHDYPGLSRTAGKLVDFADSIREYEEYAEDHTIDELLVHIIDSSGYKDSLALEPERMQDRLENIDQLINNIRKFEEENPEGTLLDFLQEVSLMTDIDDYNEDNDYVVMMTVHAAKGLEFRNVFIVGLEENVFPSDKSLTEGSAGLEEERRLAYVAITRAKEKLFLTNTNNRTLFGMTRANPVSRFVEEIPSHLIEDKTVRRPATQIQRPGNYDRQEVRRDKNYGFSGVGTPKAKCTTVFKVGDTVRHKTWGQGVVLSSQPIGNDTLLEIAFTEGKTKKLMANFANLEKINN